MADQGKYLTSFLEIYVDTGQSLKNLALLDEGALGTYYHEYFHYLQDVTTASGLSKIWNGFDRLRQLVSVIQDKTVTEINAPMDGLVADTQRQHFDFLEDLRGSGQIGNLPMVEADTYQIAEVRQENNPKIQEYFEGSTATAIKLLLTSQGRQDRIFTFGEYAVSETMAYMVERKFFPTLNLQPRYPYRVAVDLVQCIYPAFAHKEENIFALCDVSLMNNMPGWAFFSILTHMEAAGFIPGAGEEVIDYGYRYYQEIGWDHEAYMDYADKALQHVTGELYKDDFHKGTAQLFQASIERGKLFRYISPYAILKIYKAGTSLSFDFYRAFNFLGGPMSINRDGERTLRVPYGLNWLEPISDPAHFRVSWQLGKFLMEGLGPCSLQRSCNASHNKIGVDNRCEESPWKRATDDWGCPYAAAWVLYGFLGKRFLLEW